jgi:transposase
MKYVSPLTDTQKTQLRQMMKNDASFRVRKRAHAILLSDSGYHVKEIARIYQADRNSVSSWIDAWEQQGMQGLYDNPRSGRPVKLTEEEKQLVRALLEQFPRRPKLVINKVGELTGKLIGKSTLKRIARAANLSWKRVKKSLKSTRDEQAFEHAKTEIKALRQQQQRGEIDLFYFDESGFSLEPVVPYAWQPIGEYIEIPASKSSRFNVLGFLNTSNQFHSFVFECSITSDVVIACFDWFSEQITRKTVVLIDNASIHTSDAFQDNLEQWEAKGLVIKRLPAYCPELNLIEILWRFIKYEWLPLSAYESLKTLIEAVEHILRKIGSEYWINFAELPAESSA